MLHCVEVRPALFTLPPCHTFPHPVWSLWLQLSNFLGVAAARSGGLPLLASELLRLKVGPQKCTPQGHWLGAQIGAGLYWLHVCKGNPLADDGLLPC